MKPLLLIFALLAVPVAAFSQTTKPNTAKASKEQQVSPFAEYVGDWVSTFDGKVWLLLQLELHGDQLTGWLTHSRDLEVNDEGGLKSVSDDKVKETISEATVNPDGLLITVTYPEQKEPDHYLMRLLVDTKDAGDLKMIGEEMPPGMPKPKPWVIVKFVATPASKAPATH
jgi:hypothetical protein